MKQLHKHTNKFLNKTFTIGLLTVATVLHLFENRYNGEVNRFLLSEDGTPERDEVKSLCLIKATDSWTTAKIRMETFRYQVLKIH